jgi:hypothetical protein
MDFAGGAAMIEAVGPDEIDGNGMWDAGLPFFEEEAALEISDYLNCFEHPSGLGFQKDGCVNY